MLPDEGEIPWWKFLLMGCSIIIYQHLDNLDGKQARKTSIPFLKHRKFECLRNAFWPRLWRSKCLSNWLIDNKIVQSYTKFRHVLALCHDSLSWFCCHVESLLHRFLSSRKDQCCRWRFACLRPYGLLNGLFWLNSSWRCSCVWYLCRIVCCLFSAFAHFAAVSNGKIHLQKGNQTSKRGHRSDADLHLHGTCITGFVPLWQVNLQQNFLPLLLYTDVLLGQKHDPDSAPIYHKTKVQSLQSRNEHLLIFLDFVHSGGKIHALLDRNILFGVLRGARFGLHGICGVSFKRRGEDTGHKYFFDQKENKGMMIEYT